MSNQKENRKEMNLKKKQSNERMEREQFNNALCVAVRDKAEKKYPVWLTAPKEEERMSDSETEPDLVMDIGAWNILPTVSTQPFWEKYETTGDLDRVAELVYGIYMRFKQNFEKNAAWIFAGQQEIKKHIGFSLMKAEEVPVGAVTQPFQDLMVVFGLPIQFDERLCIFPITRRDMGGLGLTDLEIFELAVSNMVKMWPACIMNLENMCKKEYDLYNVMSKDGKRLLKRKSTEYVLRTKSGELGAGTILYPGVARYIAAQTEGSFFFLLASKCEAMILPEDEFPMSDAHELKKFVTDSLWQTLLDDFKLSDSVYYYDREKDEISVIE